MKDLMIKLSVMFAILKDEKGQDLIEYGLLVALIAFAATVGMTSLAGNINSAFDTIGSKLAGAVA